jgi:cobalamin biosynthesis Mg chelatase CobN
MNGSDPKSSDLHDLAREVAKSAANSITGYGQTQPSNRQVVMASSQANTGQSRSSRSDREYWSATWLSAAAIVVALAIVAAAGWIF